jgi:hypothetical protein
MLVQEGKVTQAQIDEALRNQVIFGGRLGTNLIELGYIGEEEIARLLSRSLGVPAVSPEELERIPAELIQLFPRELAERFRVIPLGLEKKRLTLAMEEPSDLQAIDEISFRTGLIVQPVLAPEIRLVAALEKYYQIPRQMRYIDVSPSMRRQWRSDKGSTPHAPAPANGVPAYNLDGGLPEPVAEVELLEELHEPPVTLPLLGEALLATDNRDAIADAVMTYVGHHFQRGGLLLVRGSAAHGWRGMNQGSPLAKFHDLLIPLDQPSVIRLVAEGKSYYLGPMPSTPANNRLIDALGGNPPSFVCLIPLLMLGKVVAILYADNGSAPLGDRVNELQRVMTKASLAFEVIIMRNKILEA